MSSPIPFSACFSIANSALSNRNTSIFSGFLPVTRARALLCKETSHTLNLPLPEGANTPTRSALMPYLAIRPTFNISALVCLPSSSKKVSAFLTSAPSAWSMVFAEASSCWSCWSKTKVSSTVTPDFFSVVRAWINVVSSNSWSFSEKSTSRDASTINWLKRSTLFFLLRYCFCNTSISWVMPLSVSDWVSLRLTSLFSNACFSATK